MNNKTKFVFLGPAVSKQSAMDLVIKLGVKIRNMDKQFVYEANSNDPVPNLLANSSFSLKTFANITRGAYDLVFHLDQHSLDNYKWWKNWHPEVPLANRR